MRITFGMSLDGAEWSGKPASLGEIKMGPQQFLDWLESRLGLSGIPVSAPERIDNVVIELDYCSVEMRKAIRESYEYMVKAGLGYGNK